MIAMNRRNAGSALIVAMIFGIILVVAVGALVGNAMNEYRNATRSYMNTAALHLAEAGIERATCDVVKKESWTTAGTLTSDKSPIVSNYPGSYVMECAADPLDATKVIVRSLARVRNPGGSLQTERAIEAVFTKVLGTASGGIDMSLVSEKVTAQLSGQANELIEKGTKFVVGSYVSSDVNRVPPALSEVEKIGYEGGVKITGTETWTDWQGKTLSASELHNPVVFGDIEVNGVVPRTNSDSGNTLEQYTGTQSYDAAKEGTADEKTTPNINTNGGGYIYPPTDINVDGRVAGFVADSHNGTRPDQALFGGAAVTVETVNGVKIATIGEVGKKTYYEFEQLDLGANCELRVLGDVVLVIRKEMKSQPGGVLKIGAVGVDGDIIPDMTQPRANRAKLTIVAREKFHMDNNTTSTFSGDGLWLPDQLTVTGKYRMVTGSGAAVAEVEKNPFTKGYASSIPKSGTSTAEFVVHAGFTGVVNAPDNTLKLHGANNGLTIWGQVFGKDTQMTNGVRILYDPSINNKSSPDGDSLTLFSWRQIKPPANLRAELSR